MKASPASTTTTTRLLDDLRLLPAAARRVTSPMALRLHLIAAVASVIVLVLVAVVQLWRIQSSDRIIDLAIDDDSHRASLEGPTTRPHHTSATASHDDGCRSVLQHSQSLTETAAALIQHHHKNHHQKHQQQQQQQRRHNTSIFFVHPTPTLRSLELLCGVESALLRNPKATVSVFVKDVIAFQSLLSQALQTRQNSAVMRIAQMMKERLRIRQFALERFTNATWSEGFQGGSARGTVLPIRNLSGRSPDSLALLFALGVLWTEGGIYVPHDLISVRELPVYDAGRTRSGAVGFERPLMESVVWPNATAAAAAPARRTAEPKIGEFIMGFNRRDPILWAMMDDISRYGASNTKTKFLDRVNFTHCDQGEHLGEEQYRKPICDQMRALRRSDAGNSSVENLAVTATQHVLSRPWNETCDFLGNLVSSELSGISGWYNFIRHNTVELKTFHGETPMMNIPEGSLINRIIQATCPVTDSLLRRKS